MVRIWQARLAAALAVDVFAASGYDDSDGVALEDVLGPQAAKAAAELPAHAVEMLRDVMDIAGRDPWTWPALDAGDIEGEDVRAAAVGQLRICSWVTSVEQVDDIGFVLVVVGLVSVSCVGSGVMV